MTTIKEFKEWLNRFPDETIIEIAIQQRSCNYESYGPIQFKAIDFDDSDMGEGWEFNDFRNNKFIKPDSFYFGKCTLELGESGL